MIVYLKDLLLQLEIKNIKQVVFYLEHFTNFSYFIHVLPL